MEIEFGYFSLYALFAAYGYYICRYYRLNPERAGKFRIPPQLKV